MGSPRVLLVEDDDGVRRMLARLLAREGCHVSEAIDGADACQQLERGLEVELVLSDLEMPRASGREVVLSAARRGIPVVILTGQTSVQTAVELMRLGAANYLIKPITPGALRELLDEAFARRAVSSSVVGEDPSFRQVLELVKTVAETDVTVLIGGETGTGKEVMARVIHDASARAGRPFVAVNCGAIPEPLLESELFGHARGAFTGATHARLGRFQAADGGTLFLDEIGDMPLAFQVKLLRVLQERTFEVLGDSTPRTADVRVIAASHHDLRKLVAERRFREDLFYRLAVIELTLPALRERPADIPLLVDHFRELANVRHKRQVTGVSPALLAALCAHPWPGNVRELANVIERMVLFKRGGVLDLADLPPQIGGVGAPAEAGQGPKLPEGGIELRRAVEDYEHSLIAQALARTGGNKKAAADLLGLNRTTLVERLRKKT